MAILALNYAIIMSNLQEIRLTIAEFKELVSEKEYLKVQLEEANAILAIREEELELLHRQIGKDTEKKSLAEGKDGELKSLRFKLQEQSEKRKGGEEREKELENELQDSLVIYRQYAELFQHYTNDRIQLEDLESQAGEFQRSRILIEELRRRLAELESKLAILQGQ